MYLLSSHICFNYIRSHGNRSFLFSHIFSPVFFSCVCVHWQLLFMDGLSETCDLLCSPMSGFSSDKLSLAKKFVLETHPQGKEYNIFNLMHSNQKKNLSVKINMQFFECFFFFPKSLF